MAKGAHFRGNKLMKDAKYHGFSRGAYRWHWWPVPDRRQLIHKGRKP